MTAQEVPRPAPPKGAAWVKQGQRLARRIEEDILGAALPAGAFLGTEPALIQQYGVSRTVLREAVRLLEHHGIADMRRGLGGGLYVATPDSEAVTHAAALFLRFTGAPPEDLYAVRAVLEPRAAAWAAEHIDLDGVQAVSAAVAAEEAAAAAGDWEEYNLLVLRFHELVGMLSRNPVACLFGQVLAQLTGASSAAPAYTPKEVAATARAHRQIAQAIVAGDAPMAAHRMYVHMRASHAFTKDMHQRATGAC